MSHVDPSRWRSMSPHLDRLLDLPDEQERRAALDALREQDPALATELEIQLRQLDAVREERFLEEPVQLGTLDTMAGASVGAYRLVSPIGRGGMSTVWLAERSDGRFDRRVAIKFLTLALAGLGKDRFEREGGILARLAHPHIAQLLDAGVSAAGQPYLVIEHVEGQPIDQYCDHHRLDVAARLRLFLDVLDAVAHAHGSLIVHRDVKPSNVLVTNDGRVKLLDFGIAKLLEQDERGAPVVLTRDGAAPLTPAYAAPEQVTGQPVSTATDVYGLGVLLYMLLTGTHPAGEHLQSTADLVKAIVETEPRRPSDVVDSDTLRRASTAAGSSSLGATALAANAAKRDTTPSRLRRTLQGELDTILGKALKKAPAERYRSVTALADDLQRYLEHRPISARPDTLRYRTAKFVRRHRRSVALAALAAAALGAGVVGTFTQARRANQEARAASAHRDFALRQLSRVEGINDLNAFLLSENAAADRPFTPAELLARAEAVIERQGVSDENHEEMLISIGRQYWNLDDDAKARTLLGRAYELSRTHGDRDTQARAACAFALTLNKVREFERAETLVRDALAALPDEPQYVLDRVDCQLTGSRLAGERGEWKVAIERVQAARTLLSGSRLTSPLYHFRVSQALANAYRLSRRHVEANAAFADASRQLAELGRDSTDSAGALYANWALNYHLLGQPLSAEPLFRRAIGLQGSAGDGSQDRSPALLLNFARVLNELSRVPEAADYASRAAQGATRLRDGSLSNQAQLTHAAAARQSGDLPTAVRLLAELESRLKPATPSTTVMLALLESERSLLAHARGDLPAALASANRAVAIAEAAQHVPMPRFLVRRSQVALAAQRLDVARADAARALAMEQASTSPGLKSAGLGRAHLALGRALQALDAIDEARTELTAALDHLTPTLGDDHPDTRLAREQLAATAPAKR